MPTPVKRGHRPTAQAALGFGAPATPAAEVPRPPDAIARTILLRHLYADDTSFERAVQAAMDAVSREPGGQPWVDRTVPRVVYVGHCTPRKAAVSRRTPSTG